MCYYFIFSWLEHQREIGSVSAHSPGAAPEPVGPNTNVELSCDALKTVGVKIIKQCASLATVYYAMYILYSAFCLNICYWCRLVIECIEPWIFEKGQMNGWLIM